MSCCNKASCEGKGKKNSDGSSGGLMSLLTGPRRWWLFGAVGVGAGLLFGWEQLILFGIAPILISLLPCLVMCGLGLCLMKGKDKSGSGNTAVESVKVVEGDDSVAAQRQISSVAGSNRTF